jgi:hypothetical protein
VFSGKIFAKVRMFGTPVLNMLKIMTLSLLKHHLKPEKIIMLSPLKHHLKPKKIMLSLLKLKNFTPKKQ